MPKGAFCVHAPFGFYCLFYTAKIIIRPPYYLLQSADRELYPSGSDLS